MSDQGWIWPKLSSSHYDANSQNGLGERWANSGCDKFYIDDILVDETRAKAEDVVAHLRAFGLKTKPPEPLAGGSALGLKLRQDGGGGLKFSRGNET